MNDFKQLREEFHDLLKSKHDAGILKLLNVGTDNPREHHWRFRIPNGEIITVAIQKEQAPTE